MEINLERILSGVICIGLLILAVLVATSKTHIGNTQWIRTRDGMEAVGDDILRKGPDWGIVVVLAVLAILALWFGVLKKELKLRIPKKQIKPGANEK